MDIARYELLHIMDIAQYEVLHIMDIAQYEQLITLPSLVHKFCSTCAGHVYE